MKYYFWKPQNYIKREYSSKITLDKVENVDKDNSFDKGNKTIIKNKILLKQTDNNKKNELNDKLNERVLMKQTNPNPFFINSNYIDDLDTQNKFLR